MRPADNPFASRCIDGLEFRFADRSRQDLLDRLARGGRRGAIIGPHGSGKTTLVEDLAGHLEGEIVRVRLDSGIDRPAAAVLAALTRSSHQLSAAAGDARRPAGLSHLRVLDVLSSTPPRPSDRNPGWAQHLPDLAKKPGEKCGLTRRIGPEHTILIDGAEQLGPWSWWRIRWLTRHAGTIVITSHSPGRLPTIHECTTDVALLEELVRELAPEVAETVDLVALFHRHCGNVRLCFRELYDAFSK